MQKYESLRAVVMILATLVNLLSGMGYVVCDMG